MLHYLRHVPFEDLARIEDWAKIAATQSPGPSSLKVKASFDWLAIMDGPMNIYEESKST